MIALFPEDKRNAIKAFAKSAFPGFDVYVSRGGGVGPRLKVTGHGREYILEVDRPFMDEYGPVNLQSNLNCKGAAEAMKMNPGRTCRVGLSGVACA